MLRSASFPLRNASPVPFETSSNRAPTCTHTRDADSASTAKFGAFGLAECTSRSAIFIEIVSVSIWPTKRPPSFCLIEPMFMESLLDDGLEHCVRDTVLPPPPLLGRSAEPARKRHSRGPRPRPRDDPVDPWIDPNSPRLVPA